jgi:hypothetical protein
MWGRTSYQGLNPNGMTNGEVACQSACYKDGACVAYVEEGLHRVN